MTEGSGGSASQKPLWERIGLNIGVILAVVGIIYGAGKLEGTIRESNEAIQRLAAVPSQLSNIETRLKIVEDRITAEIARREQADRDMEGRLSRLAEQARNDTGISRDERNREFLTFRQELTELRNQFSEFRGATNAFRDSQERMNSNLVAWYRSISDTLQQWRNFQAPRQQSGRDGFPPLLWPEVTPYILPEPMTPQDNNQRSMEARTVPPSGGRLP